MTDKEFRAAIKSNTLKGGYILYGDEDYVKHHYVNEMIRLVGGGDFEEFNIIRIDGTQTSPDAVADAVATYPMMSERKAVVVSPFLADTLKKESETDAYAEAFASVEEFDHTVLAVVVPAGSFSLDTKGNPTGNAAKFTSVLTPVVFSERTPSDLKKWITVGVGGKITPEAADTLLDYCGTNSYILHGECSKLAAWSGAHPNETVTPETVYEICSENKEDGPFDLVNAILGGNRAEALELLKRSREKGEDAILLAGGIFKTVCEMHSVRILLDCGKTKDEICRITGLKPYPCSLRIQAVQGIDEARLYSMTGRCIECDRLIKSAGLGYEALERLVCTMPAKRRNTAK